ncbi:MAG: 4Fe-4S binding protein [Dethiobacteria bacterium]
MITLNYQKCRPDLCNSGYCTAIPACPLKLIEQEEKYGFPMTNSAVCKGCAKCVTACPFKAITLS